MRIDWYDLQSMPSRIRKTQSTNRDTVFLLREMAPLEPVPLVLTKPSQVVRQQLGFQLRRRKFSNTSLDYEGQLRENYLFFYIFAMNDVFFFLRRIRHGTQLGSHGLSIITSRASPDEAVGIQFEANARRNIISGVTCPVAYSSQVFSSYEARLLIVVLVIAIRFFLRKGKMKILYNIYIYV